jgi:hypothetical protein
VREKEVRKGIDTIAGNYKLNKSNIYFNDASVDNDLTPTPTPAPAPTPNLPTGWSVKVR